MRLAGSLLLAGCGVAPVSAQGQGPAPLQCQLSVAQPAQAGQPVWLRLRLHNSGPQDLQLLRWNTPFEGRWFAPFVTLLRDGQPLRYRGPLLKRADPEPAHYLLLPAGGTAEAEIDLALPFALSAGSYTLHPQLQLADVQPAGAAPRPRAEHQPQALACEGLVFTLR